MEICIEHKSKIIILKDIGIYNKLKYIIERMNEKTNDVDNSLNNESSNISSSQLTFKSSNQTKSVSDNIIENNKDNYFIVKKPNKYEINEGELIKAVDATETENNEEEYYFELFSIIISDYKNYPNYNHYPIISNIEKYISFYSGDHDEINLKYEFNEKDIDNNNIKLFGELFADKNKENCFLIINEKVMDLCSDIDLSNIIVDNKNIKYPFQLEVKLVKANKIEKTQFEKLIFMFFGISTIKPISNFSFYKNIDITKINLDENLEYFENALSKNKEENKIDELYKDIINEYSKKNDFSIFFRLFLKVFQKKELCHLLLRKFKEMSIKIKGNEKININKSPNLIKNENKQKFIEIKTKAEELIKKNDYNYIEFYGILLCYFNYYDKNNFNDILNI